MKRSPISQYDEDQKKSVLNEISTLKVLDSPFVLRYFEHFSNDQKMDIIIEYAEGGVVADFVNKSKNEGVPISEELV